VGKTMSRPTPGPHDQRQALRRRQVLRQRQTGRRSSATGACPREGRAIPSPQLPRAQARSRHVARRMDCGSSWMLLRITAIAVVDVGRARLAARCAGGRQGAPNCSFSFTCAMLRRNFAFVFVGARVYLPPKSKQFYLDLLGRVWLGSRKLAGFRACHPPVSCNASNA
jgi:hypothetical protein